MEPQQLLTFMINTISLSSSCSKESRDLHVNHDRLSLEKTQKICHNVITEKPISRLSITNPLFMNDVFIYITQFLMLRDIINIKQTNKNWYYITNIVNKTNNCKLSNDEIKCNKNIIFNMFCNKLDALYNNPIENGTNLLHNKYGQSQWFDSYKYFNENMLLKLCNNKKQTFFKKAFPFIGKKCCQFMIILKYVQNMVLIHLIKNLICIIQKNQI